MDVQLLGTGGPDGWPRPGCRCASCARGRSAGRSRSPVLAVVDGTLRIGSGHFKLMNLVFAGKGRHAAFLNDANQSSTGYSSDEPSHQLNWVDGLTFTGGQRYHPKKNEKD